MLFNEFVLTTRPFIRTVTEVRPEWYAMFLWPSVLRCIYGFCPRLMEYADNYFDVASFPDGETKRALERVVAKMTGKTIKRASSGADGDDKRQKKKRKKN